MKTTGNTVQLRRKPSRWKELPFSGLFLDPQKILMTSWQQSMWTNYHQWLQLKVGLLIIKVPRNIPQTSITKRKTNQQQNQKTELMDVAFLENCRFSVEETGVRRAWVHQVPRTRHPHLKDNQVSRLDTGKLWRRKLRHTCLCRRSLMLSCT